MKVKVVNAKDISLDPQFIQKISEITLKDENLGYRSPDVVKNSIRCSLFLVALDESNKVLGWIEKYKIWRNWWGLSTLYVFPEYRDAGIGRGLLIPQGVRDLEGM